MKHRMTCWCKADGKIIFSLPKESSYVYGVTWLRRLACRTRRRLCASLCAVAQSSTDNGCRPAQFARLCLIRYQSQCSARWEGEEKCRFVNSWKVYKMKYYLILYNKKLKFFTKWATSGNFEMSSILNVASDCGRVKASVQTSLARA